VVEKVRHELQEHDLEENKGDDLTFDLISKLTYVDHVVNEVLRIAPPVGAGFRKAIKTFELGVSLI
jgi:cytochrome P450